MEIFVCQHNAGVDCEEKKCETCGWNPKVSKARLRKKLGGDHRLSTDKKYKIPFKGYCEVWAETEEEALALADQDEMYFVHYDFGDPIREEDKNELD
jgi:hypothetical protein